jgi:signal transduction histidine kinase
VPYRAEGALQGVFTFDVCKRRAQEPSGPDVVKRIVDEVLAIAAQNLAQRRAEEALNRAKEAAEELAAQAQAANQAKSEFISVVSHEIRTPVTAIVGMTQALEMSGLTGEQPVLVKVMREAEDVLMSLLNNVLDLSRAETGRVVLEDICFDLRRLVRQRAELITEQARQGGTAITWSVDNDVPQQVRGDPSRLGQVLMNLLGNAVKFTQRGRIDLRVHAHEGAGGLLFSVSDTGIGIPADRIDAVFEPFMQADASTTRKYGGSGLGLAICRRLVELMGGRIWVESEVGTGSTFHFTVLLGPC